VVKKQQQNKATDFNLIVTNDGLVAVQFKQSLREMFLTVEQAKALGVGLIEMGTRAEYVLRFGADVHQSPMPAGKM